MSHPNYVFSLCLRVDDSWALHRAALTQLVTVDGISAKEAIELIGEPSAPDIGACIVACLDPGSLNGCSIDNSSADEA